jgi:hypothetical protein
MNPYASSSHLEDVVFPAVLEQPFCVVVPLALLIVALTHPDRWIVAAIVSVNLNWTLHVPSGL